MQNIVGLDAFATSLLMLMYDLHLIKSIKGEVANAFKSTIFLHS